MRKTYLFLVKEGKLKQWLEWIEYVNKNTDKVHKILKEEGVRHESCNLFKHNSKYYVAGRIEAEMSTVYKDEEIKSRHIEMIDECLEMIPEERELYSFDD